MARFIVALMAISCGTGFGYFYNLAVDKKVMDKQPHRGQVIIGLADFHNKTHPANKSQRVYLDSLLKKCVALKGKLIVEDLSSVNNEGRMICCNYGVNSCEGVLGQLASKARALGVLVDNVEYRYCRVAGIGPLLNNIQSNPHSFKSSAAITTASLHKEVVDEIDKIKKYNDGKVLNGMYQRTLADVHRDLSKIAFNAQHKSTVAHYCSNLQRKQYRQELEKLCIFDSALIDMNIMHSIASCPEAPFIFVIAGGSHIEQVSAMLKKIGYESIFAMSQPACPVIKKVVNSGSDASSDIVPQPLDITIIDKFIK
jgi:hypothetical protein